MKILLDTQVFVWLVADDVRLGEKSRSLVHSKANNLFMSYMSFFEMTIKASLGKLGFDPTLMDDLEKMGITLVYGDQKSLSAYQVFSENNKDPIDNFLIATAKVNKLKLLTSDKKILAVKHRGVSLLDARK